VKPNDVVNFGGIQALPFVLAGILGVLGVATMTHLLASAVRRRRRDLAILKTLGFSRGQITAAVLWQSALLAAVALLIGVPLGVGVGRWLWTFFATQLGVLVEPRVPVPAVLLVIPAAIVLAGIVAAVPARVASLVKPALVLRTE
jgi:ABC-type lipoprotein release transport system permease subunit